MNIPLTTEQTIFLARAYQRRSEAQAAAQIQTEAIQDYVNSCAFVVNRSLQVARLQATAAAQDQAIADFLTQLGYAGAEVRFENGQIIATHDKA